MADQKPKLSPAAIELLREDIEFHRECGDPMLATAIELLLEWHQR